MPELPEVEAVVQVLQEELPGEIIVALEVRWPKWLESRPEGVPHKAVIGRQIEVVERRGKYIRFRFEDGSELISHLRMTGRWLVDADPDLPHLSAILTLHSGRIVVFQDVRKFGRATWLAPGESSPALAELGPEPLSPQLTATGLHQRFLARKRDLKSLLLDQTFLAGLGNIYVSEILFRAKISPFRRSDSITRTEVGRIHRAMQAILTQAIAERGTTVYDYRGARNTSGNFQHFLQVYQHQDTPCPRCGATILRAVQGQRATFFCPACQQVESGSVIPIASTP